MKNEMLKILSDQLLATEELGLKMKAHGIAAIRGDTAGVSKLRDEALTAFYAAIAANESAAIMVRKLTGG